MKKQLILIFFISFSIFFSSCLRIRMNDKKIYRFFEETGFEPEIFYYQKHDRQMRYIKVGSESEVLLFLLHGSPGSIKTVTDLLEDSLLLHQTTMIAVDKPGYGFSDFGKAETSLEKQVELISPILEKYQEDFEKIIIVGSSYGGSLAVRLTMEKPEWVDGLVLAAASVAPKEEKIYWFSYPARWIIIRWFVPKTLKLANKEKFAHEEELNKMIPLWENIEIPVVILHGKEDGLIYPTNPKFAEEKLINSPSVEVIMFDSQNHFVLWQQTEVLVKEIIEMIEKIEKLQE